MKKATLLATVMVAFSSFAFFPVHADKQKVCTQMEEMATEAMTVRQKGGSATNLYYSSKFLHGYKGPEILERAWRTPVFATRPFKEEQIEQFRNEVSVACLTGTVKNW